LLRRKNKTKYRPPTIDEFLQFIPKRLDFEWTTNQEGLVSLKVPKFNSNLGTTFCKIIRKDQNFTANMDKIGSAVWKNCDGKKTVKQILAKIKKEFPKEENIDQRLILFFQQMRNLNYIDY
jgi:hypothetical protein